MGSKNSPSQFDCYLNAHPDEPMFVLLARDPAAPDLVEAWAHHRERLHGPSAKVEEARTCAATMRAWQAKGVPAEVTVFINTTPKKIPAGVITYEQIVELAGMRGTPTVTFSAKHGCMQYSGCPTSGDTFVPCEGMRISIARTGNA